LRGIALCPSIFRQRISCRGLAARAASMVPASAGTAFEHHRHAGTNFAVIDFYWDRLFGTYRNPASSTAMKPARRAACDLRCPLLRRGVATDDQALDGMPGIESSAKTTRVNQSVSTAMTRCLDARQRIRFVQRLKNMNGGGGSSPCPTPTEGSALKSACALPEDAERSSLLLLHFLCTCLTHDLPNDPLADAAAGGDQSLCVVMLRRAPLSRVGGAAIGAGRRRGCLRSYFLPAPKFLLACDVNPEPAAAFVFSAAVFFGFLISRFDLICPLAMLLSIGGLDV